MLLYFPLFHISTHFSFSKLFGSPLFQRHVPVDVILTQAMLSLSQHHVWSSSTIFNCKPMNQRVFLSLCFLVKFLTKSHSFSVSIETSAPFSFSLHFLLAWIQLIWCSWKVYLEQTVTNVYGKPTRKIERRQIRKNYLFTYLLIVRIRRSYAEGELNNTLRHTRKEFLHLPWCSRDRLKLRISKISSLHKSKNTWGVASTFPSPSIPCLMR